MNMEAWVPGDPVLDLWMLVGRVVVADQMQRLALRRFTVDLAQEVEPLDMTMALLAARDDRAVEGIQFPNALDRGVAHPGHRRQRAGTPLRRTFRFGLRGQAHDLRRVDLGLAPAA